LAGNNALGPSEADFMEIQVGKFWADVMKNTCDGSPDPCIEGPEQEECEIVRGYYQPKTATADLMVMPPL
jgi:hypothetical protein